MNNYKKEIVSPFQMENKPYNIQNNSVVQEEIKRNLKTYSLTAEFVEDTETLQAFKHVNGVIAFLCTLKKDGQVIGYGRGMSVVTATNKYLNRVINFAQNSAFIDSVVRATKMLDALHISTDVQQDTSTVFNEPYRTKEVETFVPITDKQKNFLLKLLHSNHAGPSEYSIVGGLSKNQAREKINFLVSDSESKINY